MMSIKDFITFLPLSASLAALALSNVSWRAVVLFVASLALTGLLEALNTKRKDERKEIDEKLERIQAKINEIEIKRLGR